MAAARNTEAQYELGSAHLETRNRYGFPQDSKAAEKWLTLAAKKGHVFAASKLGSLYRAGAPGVEADYHKAIQWLEPLIDKPSTRRAGMVSTPPFLRLAALYCGISEMGKALKMYQRGYNVGNAEARDIMANRCRKPGWWLSQRGGQK
ncbi:MAG: sel1 repeat family protein [Nitrospinae bacterium]|nr:sel1 repeat family protein [Nitrospinota bacterium]